LGKLYLKPLRKEKGREISKKRRRKKEDSRLFQIEREKRRTLEKLQSQIERGLRLDTKMRRSNLRKEEFLEFTGGKEGSRDYKAWEEREGERKKQQEDD